MREMRGRPAIRTERAARRSSMPRRLGGSRRSSATASSAADLDGDGYPGPHRPRDRRQQPRDGRHAAAARLRADEPPAPGGGRQFVDATLDERLLPDRAAARPRSSARPTSRPRRRRQRRRPRRLQRHLRRSDERRRPTRATAARSSSTTARATSRSRRSPASTRKRPTCWPTTGATFDGRRSRRQARSVRGLLVRELRRELSAACRRSSTTAPATARSRDHRRAPASRRRPQASRRTRTSARVRRHSCDLDGDGAPELHGERPTAAQWNMLYQNDGSGHFTEVGQAAGFASDATTTTCIDYQDNQFFLCYCTLHTTEADCAGVAKPATSCPYARRRVLGARHRRSAVAPRRQHLHDVCGDLNGDGKLDLYYGRDPPLAHRATGDSSELLVNTSPRRRRRSRSIGPGTRRPAWCGRTRRATGTKAASWSPAAISTTTGARTSSSRRATTRISSGSSSTRSRTARSRRSARRGASTTRA